MDAAWLTAPPPLLGHRVDNGRGSSNCRNRRRCNEHVDLITGTLMMQHRTHNGHRFIIHEVWIHEVIREVLINEESTLNK